MARRLMRSSCQSRSTSAGSSPQSSVGEEPESTQPNYLRLASIKPPPGLCKEEDGILHDAEALLASVHEYAQPGYGPLATIKPPPGLCVEEYGIDDAEALVASVAAAGMSPNGHQDDEESIFMDVLENQLDHGCLRSQPMALHVQSPPGLESLSQEPDLAIGCAPVEYPPHEWLPESNDLAFWNAYLDPLSRGYISEGLELAWQEEAINCSYAEPQDIDAAVSAWYQDPSHVEPQDFEAAMSVWYQEPSMQYANLPDYSTATMFATSLENYASTSELFTPPPGHMAFSTDPQPQLGSPELPTLGSAAHQAELCKPCVFVYTKGCGSGSLCQFCHLCPPGEKKRRKADKTRAPRKETPFAEAGSSCFGQSRLVPR